MSNETVQSATALELGAAILQQLPRDITQDVALGWIRNKKALGKGLREFLMPPAEITTADPPVPPAVDPTQTEFNLQVNYDRSIEDCVVDGKYDWKNNNITSKNFPTTRKGTADIVLHLIHFCREISSEDAKAEMDKRGLRPAETHELLALGKDHPELQRQFPIVALTSVWPDRDGNRRVPYLVRVDSRRRLGLCWFGSGWDAAYRFAAVPK